MRRITFAVSAIGLLFAADAFSASYVLNAGTWGPSQDKAVAAAGGTVTFRHAGAGVAVVQSDSPGFLAAVTASGGISGGMDRGAEWGDPVASGAMPGAINPPHNRLHL